MSSVHAPARSMPDDAGRAGGNRRHREHGDGRSEPAGGFRPAPGRVCIARMRVVFALYLAAIAAGLGVYIAIGAS